MGRVKEGRGERLTGTPENSVRPRPVAPITPKDIPSSRISRKLYFLFSSTWWRKKGKSERSISQRDRFRRPFSLLRFQEHIAKAQTIEK